LNAGGDCPFDISRILDVDIVVDHDGVLDIRHAGEQEMQQLFRVRVVAFL
jgi:hypothetical protein